jgi:hypothetical protein
VAKENKLTKGKQMKRTAIVVLLSLAVVGAKAAPLSVVTVGAPAINCVFNTNCVVLVTDTSSPITLPGGIGTGFLQTRTFIGGSNSPAAGLYGYEYRIDLTGITASNTQPCITNIVRCFTNDVIRYTNLVVCRTNPAGHVRCDTNRVPAATNTVVRCVTNTVPCPGTAPCITSLSVNFGPTVTLDFNASGGSVTDQVYVVTSGGVGTVAPTSVEQNDGIVTFHFADPICPGESSYFIGLVSSNAPADVRALLTLTAGGNLAVGARAPGGRRPILCDFTALQRLIEALDIRDINAPNNNARAGRLGALENRLEGAMRAAEEGDIDEVVEAIVSIGNKTEGKNAWINDPAADRILDAIDDLLECLREFEEGPRP